MTYRTAFRPLALTILGLLLIVTQVSFTDAQSIQDTSLYSNGKYGYMLTVPLNWNKYESEYTSLSGGSVNRLFLTQQTDLVSRPTKFFVMYVGTPESIFGLNKKVVQRVSRDQLVDFYIDQAVNSSVDFRIVKTYTKGEGDSKVYVIEANAAEPGFRALSTSYIQFKNDKVYIWISSYLDSFAVYAPTLQSVVNSVQIR